MGLASLQSDESSQAADVGGGQAQSRIRLAQVAGQQVEREVVATDGHDGILNLFQWLQQLHLHIGSGVQSLGEPGNDHHAIGPNQRHDYARAPLQGSRYHFFAHPAKLDPEVFVLTQRGQYFSSDAGSDRRPCLRRLTQPSLQQRLNEKFGGQDCRYGVARQTDDRFALDHSQNDGMSRPNRDAVHQ